MCELFAALLLCVNAGDTEFDAFNIEFDDLRTELIADVGSRDPLVKRYEKLIAANPKHARLGEVMLALGHLYENEVEGLGIRADRIRTLHWFRTAAEVSKPGSATWKEANLLIAYRITHNNSAEAQQILSQLEAHSKGDSLTLIKCESERMSILYRQQLWEEALAKHRTIVRWYTDDPKRCPKDTRAQSDVNAEIRSAISGTMQALLLSPGTREERAQRIRAAMAAAPDYLTREWSRQFGGEALQELPTFSEPSERAEQLDKNVHGYSPSSKLSSTRVWSAVAVFGALLAVGMFLYIRRRSCRKTLMPDQPRAQ